MHLANGLQFNLQAEGHTAQVAGDGETALDLLLTKHEAFDAMVLDIMLPGKNGFAVAADLRAARNFIPILMLTARGRPEDVLKGFASGADDYLPKPFELPILLSRVQGLLRRHQWFRQEAAAQATPVAAQFSFRDKSIDFEQREGCPVPRKAILEQVWGLRDDTDTRAIDNFVVRLRRYIEDDPTSPQHLITVRGLGYQFVPEPEVSKARK